MRRWFLVIIAVALLVIVAVYTRLHRPLFVSPLISISPVGYLPLVVRQRRAIPDPRFGIAEHGLAQMLLLGFPDDGRYHSVQHRQPEKTDTVRFLRPASRDHASTWLLGAYDTEAGRWVDEAGFRRFVRDHDGMAYIVGNELGVITPIGDSNVTPTQYIRWYDAAWWLIKEENPTALIGPFAPVNIAAKERLRTIWAEYQMLTGKPLPADFFPIHHYARKDWTLQGETASLTEWVSWLDSYQGRGWQWMGSPNYWLTEYSRPEWEGPKELDDVLAFMTEFTGWLKTNPLNIKVFVWWPSGRHTNLIHGTTVTPAGELYLELALSK